MTHQDHVNLLHRAVKFRGGRWADLGSGGGAFTLALRELVGSEGEIFSVDKDEGRLNDQQKRFRAQFPQSNVHYIRADFTHPLDLPALDGIVMANSLHFFPNDGGSSHPGQSSTGRGHASKEQVLSRVRDYLKDEGQLVLVEYNVDAGNPWVPYPLSFESFRALVARVGLTDPQLLATAPSHFLKEIYSALTFKRPAPLH